MDRVAPKANAGGRVTLLAICKTSGTSYLQGRVAEQGTCYSVARLVYRSKPRRTLRKTGIANTAVTNLHEALDP